MSTPNAEDLHRGAVGPCEVCGVEGHEAGPYLLFARVRLCTECFNLAQRAGAEQAAPADPELTAAVSATLPDVAATEAAELLTRVERFIGRYVAAPSPHALVALTLWAAHTHGMGAFESTPRLALLSPEPSSGKTRALEVLETLTPAPLHGLNASTAAIFRTIAAARPTLLLDEVDAIFGRAGAGDPAREDLRALLNAGHRRGASIPRCVGPSHEPKRFEVYAAVALAGLGDLPDTLMSRSIVVRMQRRRPGETIAPFRVRDATPAGHGLRDELAAWCSEIADDLADARPPMPDGIEDRNADVWEALLAIADAAGDAWPARARAAAVALAGEAVGAAASLGIRLLGDLREVFGEADRMSTMAILDALHKLEEAPWASLKGAPLDARGLAWRLGNYGIASTKVKVIGSSVRGYRREDLWDAWERYCPAPAPSLPEPPEPPEPFNDSNGFPVPDPGGGSGTGAPSGTRTEPESPLVPAAVPEVPEVPDIEGGEGDLAAVAALAAAAGNAEAARLFDKLLAAEEAEHAPSLGLFDPATTTSEPNRGRYGLQILVEEEEALARLRAGRAEVGALAARARGGDPEAVTELRRRADTGDAEAAAAAAAGEAALQAAADLLRETLGAEEVA